MGSDEGTEAYRVPPVGGRHDHRVDGLQHEDGHGTLPLPHMAPVGTDRASAGSGERVPLLEAVQAFVRHGERLVERRSHLHPVFHGHVDGGRRTMIAPDVFAAIGELLELNRTLVRADAAVTTAMTTPDPDVTIGVALDTRDDAIQKIHHWLTLYDPGWHR